MGWTPRFTSQSWFYIIADLTDASWETTLTIWYQNQLALWGTSLKTCFKTCTIHSLPSWLYRSSSFPQLIFSSYALTFILPTPKLRKFIKCSPECRFRRDSRALLYSRELVLFPMNILYLYKIQFLQPGIHTDCK